MNIREFKKWAELASLGRLVTWSVGWLIVSGKLFMAIALTNSVLTFHTVFV